MGKIWQKNVIMIPLVLIALWGIYRIRSVLTLFILAMIWAYVLNPLVKALVKYGHLSRTAAVVIIYVIMVAVLCIVSLNVSIQLNRESHELTLELRNLPSSIEFQLQNYPDWVQPLIHDISLNLNISKFFSTGRVWPYFSGALTGIENTFIFLIASFYFLKDGQLFYAKAESMLPPSKRLGFLRWLASINDILNNYLRGQIMLIILMATVTAIILSLLHVKFALLIGIFTGFAEIVPIIGPIVAASIAVIVAMFDGSSSLGFPPLFEGLLVVVIYFILRQLEDIFLIPYVLGKTTKLHPLMVLFAVLAGSHLWGVLGMVLAVPVAAILKNLIDTYLTNKSSG